MKRSYNYLPNNLAGFSASFMAVLETSRHNYIFRSVPNDKRFGLYFSKKTT